MNVVTKKSKENGRDRLIVSALTLFCERGYHAVSVREICDHANANPSLISFHFGGKESLLETVFDGMISEKFSEIESILNQVENHADFKVRLTLFLNSYVDYYLENSEVVRLYMDQLEREHPYAVKILPDTFGKLWSGLLNFLQDAQSKNIIVTDVDCKVLAYLLISPVASSMRSKKSTHRYCQFRLSDQNFTELLIKQLVDSVKLTC